MIHSKAPQSRIIVTGCYAQLKPELIRDIDGVDLVIGMENKLDIEKYILNSDENIFRNNIKSTKKFKITYSLSERTRSFIKIQDGCNYSCTYCTIPNARGISRSDSISETIKKIKSIVKTGIKEIVLSGINVGDFGINNENLYKLLLEIEKIDNLKRYRISSIEPNLLGDDIIELLSNSSKALPHLHIFQISLVII